MHKHEALVLPRELPSNAQLQELPGHQVPKRIHSKGGCSRDLHRRHVPPRGVLQPRVLRRGLPCWMGVEGQCDLWKCNLHTGRLLQCHPVELQ